ncbi:MAG: anaerobic ribonucleoside-triphosphate reductase activating protein [Spirochaetales bacterium]
MPQPASAERRVGLQKTSLVDFPGEIAATLFATGCNLRCPYCHNPELAVGIVPDDFVTVSEVLRFLERRSGVLTAVCITGGEPLLEAWVPEVAEAIHRLGLRVKLDTNGLLPRRIAAVRPDYVAVDLKLAPSRYDKLGAGARAGSRLAETVRYLHEAAIPTEYRTTVVPGLVNSDDIRSIVAMLTEGDRLVLAAFRPGHVLDPAFAELPAPTSVMLEEFRAIAHEAGIDCTIRDHRA